jgi:hypothetical protein
MVGTSLTLGKKYMIGVHKIVILHAGIKWLPVGFGRQNIDPFAIR